MRELERLEETLREAQQRSQSLGAIVESGKQASDLQTQVEVNEGFILLARLQKNLTLEEEFQSISEAANRALEQLEPELELLKGKKQRAQDALLKAIQEKDADPEIQASRFYQDQEKEYQKEYRIQVSRQQSWYGSLQELECLIQHIDSVNLSNNISLPCSGFAEWALEQQEEALRRLDTEVSQLKRTVEDSIYQCRKEKDDADEAISTYSQELRKLRDGKMSYPEAAERLRGAINSEFEKRGMERDAKILSELLDEQLSRSFFYLRQCADMDALPISKRDKALSFARAMTSLEGLPAKEATEENLQLWAKGEKSFADFYLSALQDYRVMEVSR